MLLDLSMWMLPLFIAVISSNRVASEKQSDAGSASTKNKLLSNDDHHQRLVSDKSENIFAPRIAGGSDAPAGSYPWFVQTSTDPEVGLASCGGALVTKEFVLTAGHCTVAPKLVVGSELGIGALNYEQLIAYYSGGELEQPLEFNRIGEIFVHPDFRDDNQFSHDIALFKLETPSNIEPVAMDDGSYSPLYDETKVLTTIGLGFNGTGGPTSELQQDHLQMAEVSYFDRETCADLWYNFSSTISSSVVIDDTMMCTSGEVARICGNDRGGPLYDEENEAIVGVTIGGDCLDRGYPNFYARISEEYEWIRSTICTNHNEPKPDFCVGVPTQSPTTTTSPSSSPTEFSCPEGLVPFVYEMMTGYYGLVIKWKLHDIGAETVVDGDDNVWAEKYYIVRHCLPCSTYTLQVTDFRGSGNSQWLPRWYKATVNDEVIVYGGYDIENGPKLHNITFNPCEFENCGNGISTVVTAYPDWSCSFTLEDTTNDVLIVDVDLRYYQRVIHYYCLPCGQEYQFTFFDGQGEYGNNFPTYGGYNLTVNDEIIASADKDASFGEQESISFSGGDKCDGTSLSDTPSMTPSSKPTCAPENRKAKFYTGKTVVKANGKIKPKKRNCKWLQKAGAWKINKFCSQTESFVFPWKTIPAAAEVCTETCNSCGD